MGDIPKGSLSHDDSDWLDAEAQHLAHQMLGKLTRQSSPSLPSSSPPSSIIPPSPTNPSSSTLHSSSAKIEPLMPKFGSDVVINYHNIQFKFEYGISNPSAVPKDAIESLKEMSKGEKRVFLRHTKSPNSLQSHSNEPPPFDSLNSSDFDHNNYHKSPITPDGDAKSTLKNDDSISNLAVNQVEYQDMVETHVLELVNVEYVRHLAKGGLILKKNSNMEISTLPNRKVHLPTFETKVNVDVEGRWMKESDGSIRDDSNAGELVDSRKNFEAFIGETPVGYAFEQALRTLQQGEIATFYISPPFTSSVMAFVPKENRIGEYWTNLAIAKENSGTTDTKPNEIMIISQEKESNDHADINRSESVEQKNESKIPFEQNPQQDRRITLVYRIKMNHFTDALTPWEIDTFEDHMREAMKRKEDGNAAHESGNYQLAVAKYTKAQLFLETYKEPASSSSGSGAVVVEEEEELKNPKNLLSASTQSSSIPKVTSTFIPNIKPSTPEEREAAMNSLKVLLSLNLAATSLKQSQHEKAILHCTNALDLDPDNIKGLYRRANAYMATKNHDKAKVDLERLIQLDPSNKLAFVLLRQIHSKEAAFEKDKAEVYKKMFSKLVENPPSSPEMQNSSTASSAESKSSIRSSSTSNSSSRSGNMSPSSSEGIKNGSNEIINPSATTSPANSAATVSATPSTGSSTSRSPMFIVSVLLALFAILLVIIFSRKV